MFIFSYANPKLQMWQIMLQTYILSRHKSAKFHCFGLKKMIICIILYSGIKYEKNNSSFVPPSYISSISLYVLYIFLGGYNSRTTKDIKFNFSAFLSCMGATKCVKFQRPKCTSLKISIFRIRPINNSETQAYPYASLIAYNRYLWQ